MISVQFSYGDHAIQKVDSDQAQSGEVGRESGGVGEHGTAMRYENSIFFSSHPGKWRYISPPSIF
ncbi:hypothetical protein CCP4SC76_5050003 [Gammaproteobacteria bacterium]